MSAYTPGFIIPLPGASSGSGSSSLAQSLEPVIVAGELVFVLPDSSESGDLVMQLVAPA